jgi:hypothetical protein
MPWVLAVVCVTVAAAAACAVWLWRSAKTLKCAGGVIYYRSPVTATEAGRLREFLERIPFFHPTQPAVLLEQDAGTYRLCLSVPEQTRQDEEALAKCAALAAGLSDEPFDGATVEVHLCDASLRKLEVIPNDGRFGDRFRFNAAELFYTPGVAEVEAITVGTYLMGKGFFDDSPKLAQLNRTPGGFELRTQVRSKSDLGPAHREEIQRMARDLSRDVFGGVPVDVRPCEGVRETLARPAERRDHQPRRNPQRVFSGPVTYQIPPLTPDRN